MVSATTFLPFDLGPFRILGLLGRGGMGNVWDARHVITGFPVAVKTIAPRGGSDGDALRAAFAREVLAMARLDHPCIVAIYEHGAVGPEVAGRSNGRLAGGDAWLAMERANAGTMRSGFSVASYAELRACLLQLLDALAHAHARGVVHRDLKPGNVLVQRETGVARLMLSDFGIAHALSAGGVHTSSSGGTPGYMAPEQILGRAERQGPWTDLYALGMLAWRLASAAGAPFAGDDAQSVVRAQLEDDRRPFEPRMPLPAGFPVWLTAMTAADERRRPVCAADAAHWLRELGEPAEHGRAAGAVSFADIAQTLGATTSVNGSRLAPRVPAGPVVARAAPPFPEEWREDERHRRRPIPPGVGASLFGIRVMKLRSRAREQDRLWRELSAVALDGRPRLVLLRGPAGCGKTQLMQWLVQRANELAGLGALYVRHAPGLPPHEPVSRAIADELRCTSRSRAEVHACASERLVSHPQRDLVTRMTVELVAPSLRADGLGARFSSPTERHRAIAHVAAALGGDRPVVLAIDDASYSVDAIALCRDIVASPASVPVLAVAAVRDELAAESAALSHAIAALPALHLGPLDEDGQRRMLSDLFPLDPELLDEVAGFSHGNPYLAHQLVAHLLSTGALSEAPRGYRLAREAVLPRSELGLWEDRLSHLSAARADPFERCLEVAAALGTHVRLDDLRAACEELGVPFSEELSEALVGAGLAHATPDGWLFAHEQVRAVPKQRALAARRWESIQLACASAYERGGVAQAALAARCYGEAGAFSRAVPLLFAAHDLSLSGGDHAAGLAYASRLAQILDRMDVGPPDPRWSRCKAAIVSRMLEVRSTHDEAPSVLAAALARAPDDGRLLLARSRLLSLRGEASRHYHDAARAVEALSAEEDEGIAYALVTLAAAALMVGRVSETVRCIQRLEPLASDDPVLAARVELLRSTLTVATGDYAEAHRTARRATALFEQLGDQVQVGLCWNSRGEAHRCAGEHAASRACYERARDALRLAASPAVNLIDVNVLLLRVAEGEVETVRDDLLAFAARVRGSLFEHKLARSIAPALAVCAARLHRWEAFDGHVEQAEALGPRRGHVSRDLGMLAELAGDLAARVGEHARARRAWELARAQLGPLEAAAEQRLSAALSRLERSAS